MSPCLFCSKSDRKALSLKKPSTFKSCFDVITDKESKHSEWEIFSAQLHLLRLSELLPLTVMRSSVFLIRDKQKTFRQRSDKETHSKQAVAEMIWTPSLSSKAAPIFHKEVDSYTTAVYFVLQWFVSPWPPHFPLFDFCFLEVSRDIHLYW